VTPATLERYYRSHVLVEWHEAAHVVVAHSLGWQVESVEVGYARDSGVTRMVRAYSDPWERLCVLVAGGLGERRSLAWDDRLADLSAGDDQRGIEDALAELGWRSASPAAAHVDLVLLDHARALRRLAGALRDRRRLDRPAVLEVLG
jgi:hypothetical protein